MKYRAGSIIALMLLLFIMAFLCYPIYLFTGKWWSPLVILVIMVVVGTVGPWFFFKDKKNKGG